MKGKAITIESKRSKPVEATVVSVIIRDFIQLTESLSATSLAELMGGYYEKVRFQAEQHQGLLTSISNHNMVLTFTGIEEGEVHARRALRCALAIAMVAYQTRFWIRQAFSGQGLDKFSVGIGIHSGELIFAEFGLSPHAQQVVSGHAVSVASVLAVKSRKLEWNVVCSEQALAEAGPGVHTRHRAVIGAEWLKHPVRVAEIIVVRDGEEEFVETEIGTDEVLDTTLLLERGTRSGRYPVFGRGQHVVASNSNSADFPTIPGYRCLRPIGQGGMSRVFLVERLRDGAHLALKFADGSVSEDSDVLYRFVEEYGLLEQIHHPNVLQIYDQGVTDDVLFIVMEYLPGGTLKQRIGSQGMAPEQAWKVLREMAQALVEVHRMGIIHRDIKPENIMLRSDGTAVLGDFGVARRIYEARHYDKMEYIVGTPYFMSPEQAIGEVEDERTDIYSMGAVFFNMLTGEKPYQGESLKEIIQQHLHAPVPQLPVHCRHLQFFLERMMSKDRQRRCSAGDLLPLLEELKEIS